MVIAGACLLLNGCAVVGLGLIGDEAQTRVDEADIDWVVVIYTLTPGSPAGAMNLLDTEMAANAALKNAGAGWIDGNEVDAGEYQLYFVGPDRRQMWQVLEPIFASAPLNWSRVELYRTLAEDPDEVILPR